MGWCPWSCIGLNAVQYPHVWFFSVDCLIFIARPRLLTEKGRVLLTVACLLIYDQNIWWLKFQEWLNMALCYSTGMMKKIWVHRQLLFFTPVLPPFVRILCRQCVLPFQSAWVWTHNTTTAGGSPGFSFVPFFPRTASCHPGRTSLVWPSARVSRRPWISRAEWPSPWRPSHSSSRKRSCGLTGSGVHDP